MSSDDDDLRDEQRRRREELSAAAFETSTRVNDAILRKDPEAAGDALGVPRAEPGSGQKASASYVPTIGEQFRAHSEKLLSHLRSCHVLPDALLDDWIARIEWLDVERSLEGLPVIEEMWDHFERIERDPPPARSVSSSIHWDQQIPRIGNEMWWVREIFRHLNSSSPSP